MRANFPPRLLDELPPDLVFLSPGPGTPAERGMGAVVRQALERSVPLFGVCLGHQGLAEHFGARLGVQSVDAVEAGLRDGLLLALKRDCVAQSRPLAMMRLPDAV